MPPPKKANNDQSASQVENRTKKLTNTELINQLLERVEFLENENKDLRKEVLDLKKGFEKQSKSKSFNSNTQSNEHFLNLKSKEGAVILNQVNMEQNERTKRENNLVISGLEIEDCQDENLRKLEAEKKIVKVLEKVDSSITDASILVKTSIIKKRNESSKQLILITFKDKSVRDNILKNSKRLSETEYKNTVFVNADLTRAEREIERDLRKKQKEENSKLTKQFTNSKFKFGEFKNKEGNTVYFYWGRRNGQLKRIFCDPTQL